MSQNAFKEHEINIKGQDTKMTGSTFECMHKSML